MTNNNIEVFKENVFSNNEPYSVTEFSFAIKKIVENNFTFVKIRGEVFRPSFPNSGHVYFTLKDEVSSVSAVIWKYTLLSLDFVPEEGMDIICSGKITTFSGQSKYQIIVSKIELAGQGALLKELEERKKKYFNEGLFSSKFKKNIPFLPNVIGIVTSSSGAVIKDILQRLSDRFPTKVYLWSVSVQGSKAAREISNAIDGFNKLKSNGLKKPDLIIVARGGGSLEDLWAFNEEIVIRSVFKSKIPIISAIGHETDTTLIDFVSDLRVPTPTAAAEKAVPIISEMKLKIEEFGFRLKTSIENKLKIGFEKIEYLTRLLDTPDDILLNKEQKLDFSTKELEIQFLNIIHQNQEKFNLITRLFLTPELLLRELDNKNKILESRINSNIEKYFVKKNFDLKSISNLLEASSFQKTLERGFTIIMDKKNKPIKLSSELKNNSKVKVKFFDGTRSAKFDV